jgi:hypothetical protein
MIPRQLDLPLGLGTDPRLLDTGAVGVRLGVVATSFIATVWQEESTCKKEERTS